MRFNMLRLFSLLTDITFISIHLQSIHCVLCYRFPKNFIFSAASASHQVEGAWNEDGKGENIWDRLCHTRPDLINNKDNADVASNSYHLYKEDVRLLKEIGFQMYRFSISWSRIMPNGDITSLNQKGIDYYNNLINELVANNIEPMVTIYHWDLPQKLQDMGGFTNPLLVDYFVDYARVCFKLFGDRVKWWVTFNEPENIIGGYRTDDKAPALILDSPADYIVAHTLIRAHGKIYRLYDNEFRSSQRGKVAINIAPKYYEPKTNSTEDKEAAERAFTFLLDLFAHPILSKKGDYPKLIREIVDRNSKKEGRSRSRLPRFTTKEIEEIRGSYDYVALNHYTTNLCTTGTLPSFFTFDRDANVIMTFDPSWPSTKCSWFKVVPWGFRKILIRIRDVYGNPDVFITENGYCDSGQLIDTERISYLKAYMMEMLKAIHEDGCNVIGYTAWSLIDNFEWKDGYSSRFGVVRVDFNDTQRKRTMKHSAFFFRTLISTRTMTENVTFDITPPVSSIPSIQKVSLEMIIIKIIIVLSFGFNHTYIKL